MYHFYNVNRPDLFKKDKNKQWVKEACMYYAFFAHSGNNEKLKEALAYNLYNNIFYEEDFEYITKEFGNEYPARIKKIPLIRPLFERILGEELLRNRKYFVRAVSKKASVEKLYKRLEGFITQKLNQIQQKYGAKLKDPKSVASRIATREMEIIEDLATTDIVTEAERTGEAIAKYIEYKYDVRTKNKETALDLLLTGKCYWRWHIPELGSEPQLRIINPLNVFHDYSQETNSVRELSWIVEVAYMTRDEILGYFANELTREEINKLKDKDYGLLYKPTRDIYTEEQIRNLEYYMYSGSQDTNGLIPVYFVEFKAYDEIAYLKKKGELDIDPSLIEEMGGKYIENLYSGIVIGSDIVVRAGRSIITPRPKSRLSRCYLTYNGYLNRLTKSQPPHSYYFELKDLEELYQILHYHKEKLVALSGVKGMVYDKDAMPRDMDLKDVLYYKKLGLLLISSSQLRNGFNQLTQYNDALDASVQVILNMIDHVYLEAMRILGLNVQRMGEIKAESLVGTTQEAIRQSAYTTESIFNIFDSTYKMMVQDGVWAYQLYYLSKAKNGFDVSDFVSYVTAEGLEKIARVSSSFVEEDYGIFYVENKEDLRRIEELKQTGMQMAASGALPFSALLKILRTDSLREMDFLLEKEMKAQEERMMQMEQQKQQIEDQLKQQEFEREKQLIQLKMQLQKEIKQLELQLKGNIEQQNLSLEAEKQETEKELKEKEIELKERQLELEAEEVRAAEEIARIRRQNNMLAGVTNFGNRREVENI
jgi:hypothetical protein